MHRGTDHHRYALSLFFLLCVVSSCKETTTSPSTPPGVDQLQSALNAMTQLPYVHSFLVAENGALVSEHYFGGYSRTSPHDVRSVSKSFLSAIVGLALRDSLIGLDQRVLNAFPEYQRSVVDSRVENIVVRDLLTMKGGFDIDQNIYTTVFASSDWIRTTLSLMLVSDPGTTFHYSTPAVHVLAGVLNRALENSLTAFADTSLFEPLGITVARWPTDPQGNPAGGNLMQFTPRAMVRFGLLYLNNGQLDGEQIVPADWVRSSLTNTQRGPSGTWGDLTNEGYGYLWWLGRLKNEDVFLAIGFGGQYILCVPQLHMVVVTTAEYNLNYTTADEHERAILHVINEYLIPPFSQ